MMEKEVAFEVLQLSVEEFPDAIDAGFAVSTQVGAEGGGVVVTVTVTLHVSVWPLLPVAVPV